MDCALSGARRSRAEPFDPRGQGRQGARALSCRMRSTRRHCRPARTRPLGIDPKVLETLHPQAPRLRFRGTRRRCPKRSAVGAGDLARMRSGKRNACRSLSALARPVLPTSSDLRFHPGLKHPSGTIWPAMVALVTPARWRSRSPSTARFSPAMAPPKRRSIRRR